MDQVTKSLLTSAAGILASSIVGFAVNKAWITADQGAALTSNLSAIFLGAGAAIAAGVIAWVHSRQVTQPAMIQAVNAANNGVKVVPSTSPTPAVSGPLK